MKEHPGAGRANAFDKAVVRHVKPALTVRAEVYLPIGWYRGNASRPFFVDRGFFDLMIQFNFYGSNVNVS